MGGPESYLFNQSFLFREAERQPGFSLCVCLSVSLSLLFLLACFPSKSPMVDSGMQSLAMPMADVKD